jgi:hypothetical protein
VRARDLLGAARGDESDGSCDPGEQMGTSPRVGALSRYFRRRRDLRAVQETIRVYEECMRADWEELNAFETAVSVGERIGFSPAARSYLATNPPLERVIERNREALPVRSFLADPELTFTFPG